jgi:hypothetical protein
MNDESHEFDVASPVRDVIRKLLLIALPADLRACARELAERLGKLSTVAPYIDRTWGELSEAEGTTLAREVGMLARAMIEGAGSLTMSGEHLH